MNHPGRSNQLQDIWPVPVENTSSEEIPPYALLRVSNAESNANGHKVRKVAKPNGSTGLHLVNGPTAIPQGGFGMATDANTALVAYDTAETPAVGETWGPKNDSWLLSKDQAGFEIQGGHENGRVAVARASSGKKHEFLRLTVGSYNPTTKIVTGTGTPLNLPSGSKAAPEGTIKAFNYWEIEITEGQVLLLVYSEGITTVSEESIDWLVVPSTAPLAPRVVTVKSTHGSQEDGDPVKPFFADMFEGLLNSEDIWLELQDDTLHALSGLVDDRELWWLPRGAKLIGFPSGTWDPDPEGEGSDERSKYLVQHPDWGLRPGFVGSGGLSAADYEFMDDPAFGTGEVVLYGKAANGDIELSDPVTVVNTLEKEIAAGTPVMVSTSMFGLLAMPACDVASGWEDYESE